MANDLAYLLAMHSDPAIRDPSRAVELAQSACRATGYRRPELLDTLAVSYQAHGRREEAIQTLLKAMDASETSGNVELLALLRRRMETFQQTPAE